MYRLRVDEDLDKIFKKLEVKDKKRLDIIHKKILQICENPFHEYKPLRSPLQNFRRVHVDSSFVLIFQINHYNKTLVLHWYDHHDNVYAWRPK